MSNKSAWDTIFQCRCCSRYANVRIVEDRVTLEKVIHVDDRSGTWRDITNIDGPNSICHVCVSEPDCLDHLIEDGYDNASITIEAHAMAEGSDG